MVEKIIQLTEEQAEFLAFKRNEGDFSSEDDVVRAAIPHLMAQQQELQEMLDQGYESLSAGKGRPLEAVRQRARETLFREHPELRGAPDGEG